VQVEERGLELLEDRLADVEEPGSAGGAEVLAPGGGQHVAADPCHVDGHLSDGLAGVEEVEDPGVAGEGAYFLGGVDQPALGGDVGDGHELHRPVAVVEAAAQVGDRELAGLVVVEDLDDGAGAGGNLQEGDDVAGVLGAGGQDPVSGFE
jgi:hypothetical protein